ncbi:hypothetical protein [Solibacillus sp. FSL K6-1554]|uniref:hypothetical protein n=1 Tax=Solibacillus sp. FSL K6-1554 TaxID=2921472 RepID=UPI0030F93A26
MTLGYPKLEKDISLKKAYDMGLDLDYREIRMFLIDLLRDVKSKEKIEMIVTNIQGIYSFHYWKDEPWMQYVMVRKSGDIFIIEGKADDESRTVRRNYILGRLITVLTEKEKDLLELLTGSED